MREVHRTFAPSQDFTTYYVENYIKTDSVDLMLGKYAENVIRKRGIKKGAYNQDVNMIYFIDRNLDKSQLPQQRYDKGLPDQFRSAVIGQAVNVSNGEFIYTPHPFGH